MQFTFGDDFVKQLMRRGKKDKEVALSLAQEFYEKIEPTAMAMYLLTRDAASSILTEQLVEDPIGTIKAIDKMPDRASNGVGRKRGRKPVRKAEVVKKSSRGRPKKIAPEPVAPRGKRHLKTAQIEKMKEKVIKYLDTHPGSSRQQLIKVGKIPSAGIYNRVIGELKESGDVVGAGEKRNVVYSLTS